jgi:non-canonical purine NTP pyrophosphatase (RdgB/HAM1 family)
MPTIYLVTGNSHKLAEFTALLPADFDFKSVTVDLPELQSFDTQAIISDKVQRAYDEVGKPVMVEDVSIGLDHLNGFPGPFIKFVEQQLGKNGIYLLAGEREVAATVTSTIGYYDGHKLIIAAGVVRGTIVSPRGEHGWGFDFSFVPHGKSQTFAEMGPEQKSLVSHRAKSVHAFLEELNQL